jgi:nitroreductase
MNPILEQEAAHRSIRAYTNQPVPADDVLRAVAAAQMAATSSNVQAYSLIQVEDPAKRARLCVLTGNQPQVEKAGAFFVVCADQRRFRLMATDHDAPYAANLETFLVGVIDASLFAQNLVLGFESMGYGTCYIGGLRLDLPAVDELLELPPDVFPLYGLVVGQSAEDPHPRPRLAPEAVLFHDRYPDEQTQRAQIAEYDRRMTEYYTKRGARAYDWSEGVYRKFEEPHREQLLGYYESKGALFR